MSFRSIYRHGFARVAACTTAVAIANPSANAATILKAAREAHAEGAALALLDRKSTRLNSSHSGESRMPSSA